MDLLIVAGAGMTIALVVLLRRAVRRDIRKSAPKARVIVNHAVMSTREDWRQAMDELGGSPTEDRGDIFEGGFPFEAKVRGVLVRAGYQMGLNAAKADTVIEAELRDTVLPLLSIGISCSKDMADVEIQCCGRKLAEEVLSSDGLQVFTNSLELAEVWLDATTIKMIEAYPFYSYTIKEGAIVACAERVEHDTEVLIGVFEIVARLALRGRALLKEWHSAVTSLGAATKVPSARAFTPGMDTTFEITRAGTRYTVAFELRMRQRVSEIFVETVLGAHELTTDVGHFVLYRNDAEVLEDARDAGELEAHGSVMRKGFSKEFLREYELLAAKPEKLRPWLTPPLLHQILELMPERVESDGSTMTVRLAGLELSPEWLEVAMRLVESLSKIGAVGPYR